MKLVVVIPAYNEERTVGSVISGIPRKIERIQSVEVLLVDDGSTDSTVQEARKAGVDVVLQHEANLGLGAAFRDGVERALAIDADIVVNIDADLQYRPSEIPLLIKPILDGDADIVLGNRQIRNLKHMPFSRKVANMFATWVTRRLSGLHVQDAQTGFRAFSRRAASSMGPDSSYTHVHETLIRAGAIGLRLGQVPVTFEEREGKSRLIPSIWKYAISAGRALIKTYARYHPLKFLALLVAFSSVLFAIALVSVLLSGITSLAELMPFLPTAGGLSVLAEWVSGKSLLPHVELPGKVRNTRRDLLAKTERELSSEEAAGMGPHTSASCYIDYPKEDPHLENE